ncbi:MAG: bifunctional sulfate adenylyltransferase/adenylylsulfate kinase [bacterium]|nr:bifunctional sulfate adenylyltransferase/adenylylsulfate kinase [bacterium]
MVRTFNEPATRQEERRLTLSERQLHDLEQILVGGFAPLSGFLTEEEYIAVVDTMHLPDGALWPIPVILDVSEEDSFTLGEVLLLCDEYGNPLARFTIASVYTPDKKKEARLVYGTESLDHPGVRYLMEETGDTYLGGPVELIARAKMLDFRELRKTPQEVREELKRRGWDKVVAFQTRNPIHRAHFELIRRAAQKINGHALVHPAVGLSKEGDIDYISRVRSYKRLAKNRMKNFAMLALLPLAMRLAGPRSALWHALIRKNYGATHFIIGRDHASPGKDSRGVPFYEPYAAHELAASVESELGIGIITSKELVYVEKKDSYLPVDEVQPQEATKTISGTDFRRMLRAGEPIPEWFSFPEVIEELLKAMDKEKYRGAVVFLTGLSGAGKSTIAHILYNYLLETSDRSVTLLDGDVVRRNLSKGLGFSKKDRNINIERIGFVANEIAKHGGIAICAAIAPYKVSRDANRKLTEKNGTYIEVYVSTPLSICEGRDSKGLYKKARAGNLQHFTGIDDPYEVPESPELTLATTSISAEESAEQIVEYLRQAKLL